MAPPTKQPTKQPTKKDAYAAGLRWVNDDTPGLRRVGSPQQFRYVDASGRPVRAPATLARIRSLAIPPAWTEVWISPDDRGHIQATGRDARGRKQYRYHPSWHAHRDANKYERMIAFGQAVRRIRAATERDLALPGMPREKVIATVVRLLEVTHARVGNSQYTKANKSYGLTTLERRHVDVTGSSITFRYRGKSGVLRQLTVKDPRLARIVRRCDELPGQRLFEYLDEDGAARPIASQDVNEYIRAASGGDFSAKDYRTLAGTVLAARALRMRRQVSSKAEAKRAIKEAIAIVAQDLGNTVAVARRCYVHPAVLEAYEREVERDVGRNSKAPGRRRKESEEAAVLRIVANCAPIAALAVAV